VAELVIEVDRIERGPARQEIVAGHVAEVGCVRGGADVGGDARLVDADNIVPAALDQMVRNRCANDAAKPDDDDLSARRKSCHFYETPFSVSGTL
jgi:hypothetical protein